MKKFLLCLKRKKIELFLFNLIKILLKYIFFILPYILIFKTLYVCWYDNVWTFAYFSQQFVSNVPFIGRILSENIWGGNNLLIPLDKIQINQNISQLIFVGGIGSCLGKTIFETWFNDYFKQYAVAGSGGLGNSETPFIKTLLILKSTSGSNLNLGSGPSNDPMQGNVNVPGQKNVGEQGNVSTQGTVKSESEFVSFLYSKVPIDTFYNDISPGYESYIKILKRMNDKTLHYTLDVPKNNTDPSITRTNLAQSLFVVQKTHANILTNAFLGRDAWLGELRHYLLEEDRKKIEEISENINKAREDYLRKIETLEGSDLEKIRSELKQFFDYTNTYRNTVKKDLSRADDIMRKGLKEHPLYKKKEFRTMINRDYPKLLKAFHDEDEALKKRLMEVFNKSKKDKE